MLTESLYTLISVMCVCVCVYVLCLPMLLCVLDIVITVHFCHHIPCTYVRTVISFQMLESFYLLCIVLATAVRCIDAKLVKSNRVNNYDCVICMCYTWEVGYGRGGEGRRERETV